MSAAHLRLACATVACGIVTGLGAVGYYFFSVGMIGILFTRADMLRETYRLPFIVLVPTVGFLLVGRLLQAFPATQIGGIRQVRIELQKHKQPVPLVRAAYVLLSCTILSFGASSGSEGPVAQLGALIGNRIGRFFRIDGDAMPSLMRAGVAAGTAALFRSPLGGIALTIELFDARFNWQLLPVAVASGFGYLVRIALRGNEYPLLPPGPFDRLPLFTVLVLMPVMGVLSAFAGRSFLWIFDRCKTMFPKAWPLWFRVMLGGLLVGIISIWFPQVLSGGYPVIRHAMDGGIGWQLFLLLFSMKMLATSITFGSGAVGGLFAPTFVIGGLFGGAFGYGIHAYAPWAIPQGELFVMLGAILAFTCVVKCYWSGLLIIMNLSGSYTDLLLPALVGGAVAYYVSARLNPKSIYMD